MTHGRRKILATLAAGAMLAGVMAVPAGATPKDADGEHKVTICHVTNSVKNPFVVITVDVAAFDGKGRNDHTQHLNKAGAVDELYIDGFCGGPPPTDQGPS